MPVKERQKWRERHPRRNSNRINHMPLHGVKYGTKHISKRILRDKATGRF